MRLGLNRKKRVCTRVLRAWCSGVLCAALLALSLALVPSAGAQGYNSFRAFTTTFIANDIAIQQNRTILYHQLSWAGNATGCTVSVDSSPDAITWTTGGIVPGTSCSSTQGVVGIISGVSANFIRINVTALATGTVNVVYTGWSLAPAVGGGGTLPYVIDGVTNTSPQSIYSQTSYNGGQIFWTAAPGQTVSYLSDIFRNHTTPQTPTVTLTTTCPGVTAFLSGSSANFLAVQQVQMDPEGDTLYSPVTQVQETNNGAGVLCYTVSPSNALYGGNAFGQNAGYFTIAQECAGACPVPLTAPTYQYSTTVGKLHWYFVDTTTTRLYNFTNATVAASGFSGFQTNATALPNDGGLCVPNTHIYMSGQSQSSGHFILFPFSLCQYDQVTATGRGITQIQLSQSAPNGIPSFMPYGVLKAGAGETVGAGNQARAFILGLAEGVAGSGVVENLSPVFTLPFFTTAFAQETMNNPAPPYLPQNEIASTQYLIGSRVTDNNNVPSVWKMTATASGVGTSGTSSSVLNGTGKPFGTLSSTPCTTVNVTTVTDNQIVWTCILKGTVWVGGTYLRGTEFYDSSALDAQGNVTGGYLEVVVQGGGAAANNPSGGGLCVGCSTSVLADGYQYTNLGLTVVINPSFVWYSSASATTVTQQNNNTAPTLDTSKGVSGFNYGPWSSCSGSTLVNNCGTGGGVQTSTSFWTDTFSGALPALTVAVGACPTGNNCTQSTFTYRYVGLWTTPTGPTAAATGVGSVAGTSGTTQFIRISYPGNPPPNATGWTVGTLATATATPFQIAVDGWNIMCSTGGTPTFQLSGYTTGLFGGGTCALGQDMYIINGTAGASPQSTQPFDPYFGSTDNFVMIGNYGIQGQQGIPFGGATTPSCYNCRIDGIVIEDGRSLNIMEPYGTGIYNMFGQEGSGAGVPGACVQISDAAWVGMYNTSNTDQNTDGTLCGHYTGENYDYSWGWIFENIPDPRTIRDLTAFGPQQTTPFLGLAGVLIKNTPGQNINGSNTTISIGDIESEMTYCTIRVDNASANIDNIYESSASARTSVNGVCLGSWAHDVNIRLVRAQNASGPVVQECPVENESFGAILNPSAPAYDPNCGTTLSQMLGWYWEGDVGGTASQSVPMPVASSDALVGSMRGLTGGVNPAAAGTAANPSVVTLSPAFAQTGAFSCDPAASTGTCTVNDTAVTAKSIISINPVTAYTGLTCNAAADTGLTKQRLNAQTAGTSFSVNLGTFTTTAECFTFTIIN